MKISPTSRAAALRLSSSADILLRNLEAIEVTLDPAYGPRGAADNVRRYLVLLNDGLSNDDALTALKGANLLTTVNKGLADSDLGETEDTLGAQAFTVAKDASEAAKALRADAGIPF